MDTRQIEYFVAIAEELHFGRAAIVLGIAQSTLSAGLRSLEREIGSQLLERNAHRVALTPVGEAVLPEARTLLEHLGRIHEAALPTGALVGRLRIGFQGWLLDGLPNVIGKFQRDNPALDVRFVQDQRSTADLLEDVRAGRFDLAFTSGGPVAGVDSRTILQSRLMVVLPSGHALVSLEEVSLAQLASERFVDAPPNAGSRALLDRAFQSVGARRLIMAEFENLMEIPGAVAAGLGVAVIPEPAVAPAPGVVYRQLEEDLVWRVDASYRRESARVVEALLDEMPDPLV